MWAGDAVGRLNLEPHSMDRRNEPDLWNTDPAARTSARGSTFRAHVVAALVLASLCAQPLVAQLAPPTPRGAPARPNTPSKPESKPDSRPESRPDSRPESRPDARPESKPTPGRGTPDSPESPESPSKPDAPKPLPGRRDPRPPESRPEAEPPTVTPGRNDPRPPTGRPGAEPPTVVPGRNDPRGPVTRPGAEPPSLAPGRRDFRDPIRPPGHDLRPGQTPGRRKPEGRPIMPVRFGPSWRR